MKSAELIRIAKKNGWKLTNHDGTSHMEFEKNGKTIIIPFHGGKEVPTGLCHSLLKKIREGK
jgi:predicted RNA binding protein YcfA (HicA-like mRNA interferase family)